MSRRAHNQTFGDRQLKSLSEIREIVCNVSYSLDAVCEMLWLGYSGHIAAAHIHTLLKPLDKQLTDALNDFNDMRL